MRATSITVVVALLTICLTTAFAQSPPPLSFLAAETYEVGTTPLSVAVGDFNGDGNLDLAVANEYSGGVSVLLGNNDGTFEAAVSYGSNSCSVAVADFNGDGKLDLATAGCYGGGANVLLGNGDGTFRSQMTFSAGSYPISVAVGDFNHDGKPDLAVANEFSNNVSVLLGNGDGTFQTATNYGTDEDPGAVAIADLNGDGKLDLTVANWSGNEGRGDVSVLLGNGDGTFQPAVNYTAYMNIQAASVAVADFNRDGKLDLVAGASLLLGNGDGTFQAPTFYNNGGYSVPYGMAVVDFNGDGKADLALTNQGGLNVSVLLGNGDGTFQAATNYVAGSFPYGLATGDFNGDGKPDLAVANSGGQGENLGTVSVLFGNGDGTLQAATGYAAGSVPLFAAVGDFNGDGEPDLAVANEDGNSVSVLVGNGDGTFQAAVNYGAGSNPYSIAVGDFNGDGKPDLAVANYGSSNVSVLLGNGDGTFQAAVSYGAGSNPYSIAVGDFNGDGKQDLVVANGSSDNVTVLLGNGDGSFQAVVSYYLGQGLYAWSVAVGDFNGDGKLDLVVGDYYASVLLGNGDGTFQAPVNNNLGGSYSLVVGDFNGDGKPDLATTYPGQPFSNGSVTVALGNGDGTFHTVGSYGVGSSPYSIAVSDLSGNGESDLAVANLFSGDLSVLMGNGDGTFQTALNFGVGSYPYSVAVGDFNGDGKPDLALPDEVGGVAILLNTTGFLKTTSVTVLTTSVNPSTFDQSITLTATVTSKQGNPTGTVTFYDGNTALGTPNLINGAAVLSISSLSAGSHSLTATYNGSSSFPSSTSQVISQTVKQATTSIVLTAVPNPSTFGQNVTFTANLALQYGGAATGTITFYDGSTSIGSGTVSGNQASFPTSSLSAGTHSITAAYTGDTNFLPSTSSVLSQSVQTGATTTTVVSSLNPSTYLQAVTFTATVTGQGGTPTGTVTFYDDGVSLGTNPLGGSGQASLSASALAAGSDSITASYSGDSNFAASTSSLLTQTVNQATTTTVVTSSANPGTVTLPLTFTATVAGQYGGVPTGTVTFQSNGKTLGSATLSGGQASLLTSFSATGTYSITAVYLGSLDYQGSISGTLSEMIGKATTTTTVASSANPSSFNQSITFTATVSSAIGAPPNGETITFKDGSTTLGTGTLSGGMANFTASSLTTGSHRITARYGGDKDLKSSTSTTLTQTVNKTTTTTTLASSQNPSTFGQSVTFTATVAGQFGGVPTGNVTFKDGITTLGTGTLNSSGTTTFSTSALARGTHHITASYGGDGNFKTSTGSLTQSVH